MKKAIVYLFVIGTILFKPHNILSADYGDGNYGAGSYGEGETTSTTTSSTSSNNSSNTTATPSCNDSAPSKPELFQIDVTGTSAKLFFTPLQSTNKFYISFSTSSNAEEHGVEVELAKEGVQNFTVNALKPKMNYYFKVRGQNGCMPGEWSNIIKTTSKSAGLKSTLSYYLYGVKTKVSTLFSSVKSTKESPASTNTITKEVNQTATTNPTAANEPESKQQPTKKQTCFLWWCW
ncbi:MAG: hypothetical protein UV68_C0028G0001 [Candidatus Collierbacteria bacterium GW2011_GWC2_43_12]|uniref:Fibronectin type-III domain-containing protein n=1 Tax=Candidatus Collierbacteria bacterium GW2011_GWC2_43_12 TaxID=1618390 RepID=A0A0G1D5U4_9BACT|nr:MAG: hypothetical protein UV68_C0028G0001 [Candidatus Collierbacteria bacterium GW2011_GWC2_43_12]